MTGMMSALRRAALLCVVGIVLFSAVVNGQVPQQVPANAPLTLQWDASPDPVSGYRCYLDNVKVGTDLPATARTCAFPGQASGSHTVAVSAFNTFGESAKTAVPFTVGGPPSPPTNLRLIVTTAHALAMTPEPARA